MLVLEGNPFVSGVAGYVEQDPSLASKQTAPYVSILLRGNQDIAALARIDPATPWVVLNSEINEQMGLRVGPEQVDLHTAVGIMRGSLEICRITLAAERGSGLDVDATVFVCDDWTRGNFLGYSGLLQRIRFALDPQELKFYFGPFGE